jgi:transglutaminase-like putative cysteine protease
MRVVKSQTDGSAKQTGALMHRMVADYYRDMAPYATYSLREIFNTIKNIPFRPDPACEETLMRPAYTMLQHGYGGDCDDKCIALASWCRLHGMPYRFLACRRSDMNRLHHVICQIYVFDEWIDADPTYNVNTLGSRRENYAECVII